MLNKLFVICIPGFIENNPIIPKDNQCVYLTKNVPQCDLIVSTDNYIYINTSKLTLYVSVESPLTRLNNQEDFTYTATISPESTFQLSAWVMPSEKEFKTKNPNYKRNGKGIILISNCIQFRINIVSEMCKEGFNVDVYGSCYVKYCNNIKLTDRYDKNWNNKKKDLISQYSYVLAIENTQEYNYATEKVYDPLVTHTLPFYFGASNINDLIPHPDSIIRNKRYLQKVLNTPHLYKYHTEGWRNLPFTGYKRNTQTLTDILNELCNKHS